MAKAAKSATKKSASTKSSGKRELIDTGTDKRYEKRNDDGTFKESDDVTKSLRQDVKQPAKTKVKPGHGDQGDQPRKAAPKKSAAKKKA